MVLLTTTPQILQVLSSLPPSTLSKLASTTSPAKPSSDNEDNTPTTGSTQTALPTSLSSPISHKTLIALSRLRLDSNTAIPPLDTLLRGTKPYHAPPPPKPQPTAEYTALMARLRAEQEQRDYANLLAAQHISYSGAVDADESQDDISPSLVFNILVSVLLVGAAVFQLTKWWPNDGLRVLLSLAAGIVVGVAEVGLWYIYQVKVAQARRKERAKREKKVFVAEVDGENEGAGGVLVGGSRGEGEKEEIWGRGVNGGMRRRVREKWEREEEERKKNEK